MGDTIKTALGIVTISVVLVLLLKNAGSTSTVINSIASGVATDVNVLQGNGAGSSGGGQNASLQLPALGGLQSI